jgi:hypothetical protein
MRYPWTVGPVYLVFHFFMYRNAKYRESQNSAEIKFVSSILQAFTVYGVIMLVPLLQYSNTPEF